MTYRQYELPFSEADDPNTGLPSTEGRERRVEEQGILEQAFAILAGRHQRGEALTSPESTKDFLRLRLADRPNEVFGCIFLDNRHRVIAFEELFRGTIDGASVHSREVVKSALGHNAAACIMAHNHPLC